MGVGVGVGVAVGAGVVVGTAPARNPAAGSCKNVPRVTVTGLEGLGGVVLTTLLPKPSVDVTTKAVVGSFAFTAVTQYPVELVTTLPVARVAADT